VGRRCVHWPCAAVRLCRRDTRPYLGRPSSRPVGPAASDHRQRAASLRASGSKGDEQRPSWKEIRQLDACHRGCARPHSAERGRGRAGAVVAAPAGTPRRRRLRLRHSTLRCDDHPARLGCPNDHPPAHRRARRARCSSPASLRRRVLQSGEDRSATSWGPRLRRIRGRSFHDGPGGAVRVARLPQSGARLLRGSGSAAQPRPNPARVLRTRVALAAAAAGSRSIQACCRRHLARQRSYAAARHPLSAARPRRDRDGSIQRRCVRNRPRPRLVQRGGLDASWQGHPIRRRREPVHALSVPRRADTRTDLSRLCGGRRALAVVPDGPGESHPAYARIASGTK
jgi:hypothetical protein